MKEPRPGQFETAIGNIPITFRYDRTAFRIKVAPREKDERHAAEGGITLTLRRGLPPGKGEKRKIFDSGSNWCLYLQDGKLVLQDRSFDSPLLPHKFVVLEPELNRGDIYYTGKRLHRNVSRDPLKYPLNQILTLMLLSRTQGALFHACGIIDRGRGYLFTGNSTHGKSTIAQIWKDAGATILNDDRIIVKKEKGEFRMYGTPWHGDFPETSLSDMAVRTIFFLKHGHKNRIVPRKGTEAISMMMTRSFPPYWDGNGMNNTLAFLEDMETSLACYDLYFRPDSDVIDFVRDVYSHE